MSHQVAYDRTVQAYAKGRGWPSGYVRFDASAVRKRTDRKPPNPVIHKPY
jgi:hypothetical protein